MPYPAGIDQALLDHLGRFDTPTICNALEIARGGRSTAGFTRATMIAAPGPLPPMVGFARTATLRAASPFRDDAARLRATRLAYFEHVARVDEPVVVVAQDLDWQPGIGAWWGEVHSNVHEALGCAGVVTNGAVRDLDVLAPGFPILAGLVTPSHAFLRVEAVGVEVDIFGLAVRDGDLVHADRHGAITIPHEVAPQLPRAIEVIVGRERLLIEAAKRPGFGIADIRRALAEGDDIH